MAIYCLAISPDDVTIKLFQKFKGKLRARLNRHYGSVNSMAHMTLIFFVASEENYPLILTEFKKVLTSLISSLLTFLISRIFRQNLLVLFMQIQMNTPQAKSRDIVAS